MSTADKLRALKEKRSTLAAAAGAKKIDSTPTTVKEEKTKEVCEFCGKEFSNLGSHTKKCKDNPDNQREPQQSVQPPSQPAFDVEKFFDKFKDVMVTPDQLMSILKTESEMHDKYHEKLDKLIADRSSMKTDAPVIDLSSFTGSVTELIDAIKQSRNSTNEESIDVINTLRDELKSRSNDLSIKEQEIRELIERVASSPTKIPSELAVLITSMSRSWIELLPAIEQRWKNSPGYLKVVNRLKHDIETLMSFVPTAPVTRD